jgi:hypothetical protein
MDKKYKFWRADTPISVLIYYVIGLSLLIITHEINPTNLAGPGLDIPAFLIYFILNIVIFFKTVIKLSDRKSYKNQLVLNPILSLIINSMGIISLIVLLRIPANSW